MIKYLWILPFQGVLTLGFSCYPSDWKWWALTLILVFTTHSPSKKSVIGEGYLSAPAGDKPKPPPAPPHPYSYEIRCFNCLKIIGMNPDGKRTFHNEYNGGNGFCFPCREALTTTQQQMVKTREQPTATLVPHAAKGVDLND